jgi:hypothetical protein
LGPLVSVVDTRLEKTINFVEGYPINVPTKSGSTGKVVSERRIM